MVVKGSVGPNCGSVIRSKLVVPHVKTNKVWKVFVNYRQEVGA